ncbi:MAG TPA: hypothetical protein VGQ04_20795 [Chitinophagaceae bacterium]|jgi:hypothetical protein|nr:hypothetical protein [Chitinophagaceae bacterium]
MNSTRKFFTGPLLIVSLTLTNLVTEAQAQGQICKDNFNHALGFYNRGQFENINTYVNGCIENIKNINNHKYYKETPNGITMLFKVYKICINSYRNLEQGNLAEQKMVELVSYLNWTRADVEKKLNETPLTPLE